jgi:hypothetical protein
MRWKDDRDSAMICKEADNSPGKIQEKEQPWYVNELSGSMQGGTFIDLYVCCKTVFDVTERLKRKH